MSWPVAKVGDLAVAHYGKALKKEYRDEAGPFDVFGSSGKVGLHSEPLVSQPTLVVGRKGSVGEVIWAPRGGWVIDTAYFLQLHNPRDTDLRYLFYALKRANLAQRTITTSIPGLNRDDLYDTEIPLPPLTEQKRIAAILDKADAIRRKRQQAIKLTDEFLRAVFLDMFGDPGLNSKNWPVMSINEAIDSGYILEVQDGNHGNDHPKVADFEDKGYPFIAANVVRNGKILFDKCYYLDESWLRKLRIGFAKPDDVLLSHKGSLGFTAVLDDTFDTYIFSPQTTYYRVDASRLDPVYLKGYFDSNYFQSMFKKEGIQSTRAYIGITRQKELPIPIPPMSEQRSFVDVHSRCAKLVERLNSSGDAMPDLFGSLSQRAFSGIL